ncbi:MAG: methyltransferase domain-containing protein [Candidatus Sungbacteria bacterium]|nr:methyltransferase domain-containing protein [bacterium]MDZ4260386.1 methyltransferase domain-containing protein [Candidatus Sungbacteria bacterium]
MKAKTSWGNVAEWYDEYLEKLEDSYQKNVILPNVLRILDIKKGDRVLDLACGQGFFSRALSDAGARVTGIDVSVELIGIAKKHLPKNIAYYAASVEKLDMLKSESFDAAVIILAIQNIKNVADVFSECSRVLASSGRLVIVMNHPAFRIPQNSRWGWDSKEQTQYRRIDGYLSESNIQIDMHPGHEKKETTVSFHRPLQTYINTLAKYNFGITRMEEWISHKKSMKGPRQAAEDRARKEIPLFLMLVARKIG